MAKAASRAKAVKGKGAAQVINLPVLKSGERWDGIILKADGTPDYHLVTLPGESRGTHQQLTDWAKAQGGELPNRREQRLQMANAAQHFKPDYYWCAERRAGDDAYAWCQYFGNGTQLWDLRSSECHGVAVRRVPIH
jgi:hypothetical protein